jgi:glycosyltransferase involved in cell wall biosynthesis
VSGAAPQFPLVSVIVPTRNSGRFLARCLESIRRQTFQSLEIIVIDNDSSDDTSEIARGYTSHLFTAGPERSAQVNVGVRQSRGTYVYRVDSDFELDPRVVEQCVRCAEDGFDAVVVHNSPDATCGRLARIRKFEVDMYKYDLGHSAARFLTRDAFDQIGGYDESITAGEDYDFQNRLNAHGFRTGFVEAEAVHLDEPTSLLPHLRKYYAYGQDFVHFSNKHGRTSQVGFIRGSYFRNWRTFTAHPATASQFLAYHLLKFTAGGMGYAVGTLKKRSGAGRGSA